MDSVTKHNINLAENKIFNKKIPFHQNQAL